MVLISESLDNFSNRYGEHYLE